MDRKNAWTTYSKEELDRLEQVNTEYKNCLDAGKTERECVTLAVEKAKAEVSTERIKLRTCLHKMDVL